MSDFDQNNSKNNRNNLPATARESDQLQCQSMELAIALLIKTNPKQVSYAEQIARKFSQKEEDEIAYQNQCLRVHAQLREQEFEEYELPACLRVTQW